MYSVDPERIYINMSACAGSTSTVLSPQPVATYTESRFAPIVSDLSKYKLAVVRCILAGCRNFPVLIPAIAPNQPDPLRTAYEVTMNLQVYSQGNTQVFPANGTTLALDVQTLTNGYIDAPGWVRVPVVTAGVVSSATWLAEVNAALAAAPGTIPSIVATLNAEGALHFHTAVVGMTFQLCVGLLPAAVPPAPPVADLAAVNAYGFASVAVGSPPIASATAPVADWDAPNIPFVQAPKIIQTLSATTPLKWVSQTGVPPPTTLEAQTDSAAGGQTSSLAYWCLDYVWFAGILNTALSTCAQTLASNAAAAGYTPGFETPYVTYNPAGKSWSLWVDANSTPNQTLPASGVIYPFYTFNQQVVFNGMLQDLFQFPASYDPRTALATLNFTQSVVPASGGDFIELPTPFSPTANVWSPVDSLIFASQLIPVRSEIISAPTVYGSNGIGQLQGGTTSYDSTQILTDVIPAQGDSTDWRSEPTIYSPTVLRWVDLPCGAMALSKIDFSLSWRNARSGVVTPVVLNPGANFSVKILLQRLDVF